MFLLNFSEDELDFDVLIYFTLPASYVLLTEF